MGIAGHFINSMLSWKRQEVFLRVIPYHSPKIFGFGGYERKKSIGPISQTPLCHSDPAPIVMESETSDGVTRRSAGPQSGISR